MEWLLAHGKQPLLYYFNPNIFPEAEYRKRKAECSRYAARLGIDVIDGDYDHAQWLQSVQGLEQEPERGKRCTSCFRIRLLSAAQEAEKRHIARFATTLAGSRWKDLAQIHAAGHWAAAHTPGTLFWEKNWRKDGLSERRRILLAENRFYNQTYCGCEFSIHSRTG
jgi:predicted adenine nucleotide alpha hydrolase (AANH) superfamily ATPase